MIRITENTGESLKFMWIDKHTMVFEWDNKNVILGKPKLGKSNIELIISQEDKDLFFLDKNEGGRSIMDQLCFFCDFGISPVLLGCFDLPSCLLGKDCGWVNFCRDFKLGTPFGVKKKLDLGERLVAAEKVFQKIIWQDCEFCEHWNEDNVFRVIENGEEKTLKDYGSDVFINDDNVSGFCIDSKSAFCDLLRFFPALGFGKTCKKFRLSHKKDVMSLYRERKGSFKDYLDRLKL